LASNLARFLAPIFESVAGAVRFVLSVLSSFSTFSFLGSELYILK